MRKDTRLISTPDLPYHPKAAHAFMDLDGNLRPLCRSFDVVPLPVGYAAHGESTRTLMVLDDVCRFA
ncbi:hypothetical protein [Methanolobus chelungpuianus]|uniref:hypothetical protein n=1 Tax=Methanolobus chelungpuianus TaxID=502115 RepID=UPI002113E938|nr:hypothetical protein [Methanolobus chelungpuianus]